jgi:hypothetical protein
MIMLELTNQFKSIFLLPTFLFLLSCDDQVTLYDDFDRSHVHITDPIDNFRYRIDEQKLGSILDFSYIEKYYPGAIVCFKEGYGAYLGGVSDTSAKYKPIYPGPRYSVNQSSVMAIVTDQAIYTFAIHKPAPRGGYIFDEPMPNFTDVELKYQVDILGSDCFFAKGAIGKLTYSVQSEQPNYKYVMPVYQNYKYVKSRINLSANTK